MIWVSSTFLGLSSALLLNDPCALASLGYLVLRLYLIAYSLSSTLLLERFLHFSSVLYVLSSRFPGMAVLVISCIRVLLEGSSDDRNPCDPLHVHLQAAF